AGKLREDRAARRDAQRSLLLPPGNDPAGLWRQGRSASGSFHGRVDQPLVLDRVLVDRQDDAGQAGRSGLKRTRRLVVALGISAVVILWPAAALAHPLGNFT